MSLNGEQQAVSESRIRQGCFFRFDYGAFSAANAAYVKTQKGWIHMYKKDLVYLVAGGDQRQVHLADLLAMDSVVYAIGFSDDIIFSEHVNHVKSLVEVPAPVDIIVLPIPAMASVRTISAPLCAHPLLADEVLSCGDPGTLVMGGMINSVLQKKCEQHGLQWIDYMEREELAILNAVPTAEGAIQIAMEELPTVLFGQRCLITGFGRISKVLVRDLLALGMDVTVSARKFADLAWITVYGARKLPICRLGDRLDKYDLIINTVPAKLFDRSMLSKVRKDSLIIDLASKPGGVDFDAARELGVNTIWALSLPGKVAPISAGQIICDTIYNILSELEG